MQRAQIHSPATFQAGFAAVDEGEDSCQRHNTKASDADQGKPISPRPLILACVLYEAFLQTIRVQWFKDVTLFLKTSRVCELEIRRAVVASSIPCTIKTVEDASQ